MNGPKDMFKGFMLVSFLALIVFSLVACTQPATESSAEDLEGTDSIVSLSSEAKEKLDELYPEMEENQVWRIYGAGSG